MNIHIIHLPHTFPYLIDLSIAFKKHGFDKVTLVANGFNLEQMSRLKDVANKHSFLKIMDIPTKRILSHGQALNLAFMHSKGEYFCFADHDIFPTQNVVQDIKLALNNSDVACLGNRPENTAAEYKGFAASAESTQFGIPLATSFFSIFKRSLVESINLKHKIGFEQYFRKSQIPNTFGYYKDIHVLREPFLIDTCKLLSLSLYQSGNTITHIGSDKVCHLGGLCGAINRYTNNDSSIKKEFNIYGVPKTIDLEDYYRENQKRHPKVLEVKRLISDFSLQLLIALKKGVELPVFNSDDENLSKTISEIKKDVSKLYNEII